MSYQYLKERAALFTPEGNANFILNRDTAHDLIRTAGAFRLQEFMAKAKGGNTWFYMACIERLVEMGELVELRRDCWAQYRVFTNPQVHNHG